MRGGRDRTRGCSAKHGYVARPAPEPYSFTVRRASTSLPRALKGLGGPSGPPLRFPRPYLRGREMSITGSRVRRHVHAPRNTLTKQTVRAEAVTHPKWKTGSRIVAVDRCAGCYICRGRGDHFTLDIEEPT